MSRRIHAGPLSRRFLLALGIVVGGGATMSQTPVPLPGYAAPNVLDSVAWKPRQSHSRRRPTRASTPGHSRASLASGTTAQARMRDYVIDRMRAWGLETQVRAYDVWMPHPTSIRVWRVSPDARELSLSEGPAAGDSSSVLPEVPPINGYGDAGDVNAEVVYVNYGLIEDYATLDSLDVSVPKSDRRRALWPLFSPSRAP